MTAALRFALRPGPLLLATAAVLARWGGLERAAPGVMLVGPYAAALAGLLVGWSLKRSRLPFALIALTLAHTLVSRWAPENAVAFQVGACLIPLNLAAIALLPERGVFTPAGLTVWVAILVQSGIAWVLIAIEARDLAPDQLARWLDADGLPSITPLGRSALGAFAVAGAALGAGRWLAPETTGRGYLWALAATLMAWHAGGHETDRALYLTAAALILLLAAIEVSYVLAYHDTLTGLPGRRALDEALARLSGPYTVAMVDVDHFKQFNDTHGHDVGDQVLRTVATRLRDALGDGKVFRYGGEEFAALLPGTTLAEALPRLEAARAAVARAPFAVRGRVRPRKKPRRTRTRRPHGEETLTVSIGAAEAGTKQVAADVIRAADQALYRAKEMGRNQVRA